MKRRLNGISYVDLFARQKELDFAIRYERSSLRSLVATLPRAAHCEAEDLRYVAVLFVDGEGEVERQRRGT